MLSALQRHLSSIYQVEPGYDVSDFLVTDPTLAKMLGGDALIPNTDESVLVAEDDGAGAPVCLGTAHGVSPRWRIGRDISIGGQ